MYMNMSNKGNDRLKIEWLSNNVKGKSQYQDIVKMIKYSNIPQEWDYGRAKKNSDGCNVSRGIIWYDGSRIGVIQILEKKKFGIPYAIRINRGPLLADEFDTPEVHMAVMNKVRIKFPYPIPMIYAPNIKWSPNALEKITEYHWVQWNPFGYETGLIDLELSLDQIRLGLESKWRNQLKSAEKKNIMISGDMRRFDEILDLYENSQYEKQYKGIPRKILTYLAEIKNSPLKLFYITNDANAIIAFDIFYRTDNFGLYFVGWNDEEGRRFYANNLLLFHALVCFKNLGIKWMDLGGIDYIYTEENARFKDGMKPMHYRLSGEFVRF